MTGQEPTLSPEHEARVRDLLADARHTEPLPGEVAERLDAVLAALAAETVAASAGSPRTPVVSLAARRRRRASSLLVAAAAVVAVGVGLGQVLDGTRGPGGGGDSAAVADRSTSEAAREAAPGPASAELDQGSGTYALDEPFRLRRNHFVDDATEARDRVAAMPRAGGDDATDGLALGYLGCHSPGWGAGTLVPVTYGGLPAVLVLRRVSGDTQVADLFRCGSAVVLRSTTLPAP